MWMKTNAARVLFRASHGDITKIGGFARFSRGGKRCGGRGHAGMPASVRLPAPGCASALGYFILIPCEQLRRLLL
ncbi:hypothetical protein ACGYT3_22470, partial [Burkholderia pseudomallei]